MRKLLLSVVSFLLISTSIFAQKGYETKIVRQTNERIQLQFTLNEWNMDRVVLNGENYQKIEFKSPLATTKNGWAEIPYVSANIQIDNQKPVTYRVVSVNYDDINLDYPLVPSRGVIYRNQSPSEIPFKVAPESIVDAAYPENECELGAPYIFRDIRGVTLHFFPFQYNAARNTLRVYKSINVEVVESEGVGENPLQRNPNAKFFMQSHNMYKEMFLNYDASRVALPISSEYGDIMVITTARDEEAIEPYIQWKKEKGFNVTKTVVATGTNIVNTVKSAYTANPNIMFVQLVGDWADIKCNLGGGASAPMDPMVGCVVGTDNFPEIAVGRFSCNNSAQLTAQVNKTIQYEQNPDLGNWYESAISIASNEGGGGSGDDGESDINHETIIWTNKLDPDTYNTNYTFYQGVSSNCTAAGVATAVNTGASVINYTGHGAATYFVTTGFSNANVNQLTNAARLPFIFSVACVNGEFHNSSDCFAEAWLKKANGGAISVFMSTINQPWNPPMAGQDYFNDILTGGYDYSTNPGTGTSTSERRTLIGAIHVNGQNLMLQQNATGDWLETAQTWTIFGDASLQVRTAQPKTLEVSNPIIIYGIPFSATFTADGNPVANAQVCLSQGDVYVSAFTNENGQVEIPSTDFIPGEVKLVATAFNTTTITQNVSCIPPDGAYILVDSCKVEDANGQADFGESFNLKVFFSNVGVESASNLTATISSTDPYFSITSAGPTTVGTIAAEGTVAISNAFALTLTDSVPDQHSGHFDITITDGDSTWVSKVLLKANSPVLSVELIEMQNDADDNGVLNVGETGEIKAQIVNTGHSDANGVSVTLAANNTGISITGTNPITVNIPAGGSAEAVFAVSAGENIVDGTDVQFSVTGELGEYQLEGNALITIGNKPIIYIGEGTANNTTQYPFGTYYKANRSQMLYLQSELGSTPRMISHLGFNFTAIGGNPVLTNLTIKVKEVSNTALGSSFVSTTDATVVLPATNYTMPTGTGWYDFDIEDFVYSGTGNLVVEVIFGINSNYTTNYNVACTATSFTSVNYGYDDNSASPSFDGSCSTRPNLKVTFIPTSELTFTVTDGTNPIEGANVTIGSQSLNTDSDGIVSLVIGNGTYTYSVSKEGYATVEEEITVNNDEQYEVTLYPSHEVTFTVTRQDEAIEGAQIAINNKTYTTNANGVVTLELASGTYPYTVSKDGYNDCNGSLTVADEDVTEEVVMTFVGVEDVDLSSVRVYPNPFTNNINIINVTNYNRAIITNSLGQIVMDVTLSGTELTTIEAGDLKSGIYFITLRDNMGNSMTKKIVRR